MHGAGGGLILRTDGCLVGEIFEASFVPTSRRDPSRITVTVTVEPGTVWDVQVWQGQYVRDVAPAPTGSA